jgi:peptidoglycan/xylan/chitin deacetylase (PgdA/CDA1 family)
MPIGAATHPAVGPGTLSPGHVALTFDDGPHHQHTPAILAILEQANWKATFFQLGVQASRHPQIAHAVAAAGHSIGTHTFDHPRLAKQPLEDACQEIQKGIDAVCSAAKTRTAFFRFPYGESNEQLRDHLKMQNIISFFWDVDARDWDIKDESILFAHIMKQVHAKKGGVIVMHDVHAVTVKVLPRLIAELKRTGYTSVQFVPADK